MTATTVEALLAKAGHSVISEDRTESLRFLVHDFSGHPFQIRLSRELARRGHAVRHLHCASETTGKGRLDVESTDPPTLEVAGVDLGHRFRKYGLVSRWREERRYADLVIDDARRFRPHVMLSSNTPLFAQQRLARWAAGNGVGFVYWLQDLLSRAMRAGANRRVRGLGTILGSLLTNVERATLAGSDGVVVISDDFRDVLASWRVDPPVLETIENWAPVDELPALPRDNPWAVAHDLVDRTVLLYSGTLGMKHDPSLLIKLAEAYRTRVDVTIVVVSEGPGADWIRREASTRELTNVLSLPYQPYDRLPELLASADVLLAVLEPDAGAFSVPSKILSYHCAGRAIVAAIPPENLAARLVRRQGSGIVVDPGDGAAFIAAVDHMLHDDGLRVASGRRAREYAEVAFDTGRIADRFEHVLRTARRSALSQPSTSRKLPA